MGWRTSAGGLRRTVVGGRLSVLRDAIAAQLCADRAAAVNRLKMAIRKSDQSPPKPTRDAEALQKANEDRLAAKLLELAARFDARSADKERRIAAAAATFERDLQHRQSALASENEAALARVERCCGFERERRDHENDVAKTRTRLEFIAQQVECLMDEQGKRQAALANEMARLDKAKRQLERSRSTRRLRSGSRSSRSAPATRWRTSQSCTTPRRT
jgi:hypothetical protein